MSRSGPARHAVVRWAVRLFRREWRQQALVLSLLTVAVAAAVAASTIAVNAASDATAKQGAATAVIRLDGADAGRAETAIAAARGRFGPIDVIAHLSTVVPGTLQRLDIRDQALDGHFTAPMLALRDGRYPRGADEVALTDGAAELYGATVGSSIVVGRETRTVVGIVENPANLADEFALVAAGSLPHPDSYALLVDTTTAVTDAPTDTGSVQFAIETTGSDKTAIAAAVFVATTLALALVGLIAAAGFVVVAQRRQRQLGLLSAIGATARHVWLVMVANGAIVGAVAAAAGTALGIGGWMIAAPAVESAANHRIDRFDLPWTLIAGTAVMALLIATAAGWWPARLASRMSVMTALSGRPARPRPVHRSALVAIVLAGAAVVAIVLSHPTSTKVKPPLLVGGLLAIVVASVFATPAAIRALGAVAGRVPFAPRLALRDLARHQARAAAALAAITVALGISVSIAAVASANENSSAEGNLSDHELLIRVGDPRTAPDPNLTAQQLDALDQRARAVVTATGTDASAVPLDVAFNANGGGKSNIREPVSAGNPIDDHSIKFVAYPVVATPEVLRLYGVDTSTIDPAADVLTSRSDTLVLLDFGDPNADRDPKPVPTEHADLPSYGSAPHTLLTQAALARHGWVTARMGWIVESPRPLTAAQIKAARAAAADAGLAVETRSSQDGLAALRTDSVLVGAALAMAIVAMTVGLIRGESAGDIRTLTATGASARTRRSLTATTAAALAFVGIVLGVAGAYVALIAAYHADLGRLVPLPAKHLVSLGLGLPAVAAIAGWLLAGREPRAFARQALD